MKTLLVINPGSSTLKFTLFEKDAGRELLIGNIEKIGLDKPFMSYRQGKVNGSIVIKKKIEDHHDALEIALGFIAYHGFSLHDIIKVGYRVVHGGDKYYEPTKITNTTIKEIAKFNKLAPLHNPVSLKVIKVSLKVLPKAEHWACFDTAWYKDIQPEYFLYNLPLEYAKKHKIRRYGFHGLSHEYVAIEAAKLIGKPLNKFNLISCHLGAGVSITALKKGKALTTSMGFTPLEGIMMTTRSGNMDPAVPLYLIQELKMKPQEVYKLINYESGWFGLTGEMDFRQIMVDAGYPIKGIKKRADKTAREKSQFALKKLITEIKFYIGGYSYMLGKVDAVVFTGSIGARNSNFRELVIKHIRLGKAKVLAIPTNEELMIAKKIK